MVIITYSTELRAISRTMLHPRPILHPKSPLFVGLSQRSGLALRPSVPGANHIREVVAGNLNICLSQRRFLFIFI